MLDALSDHLANLDKQIPVITNPQKLVTVQQGAHRGHSWDLSEKQWMELKWLK